MKTITIKFPEELLAKVDAAARRRGVPRSRVVRGALEVYLKARRGPADGALSAWVDAHAGAFKGPRDLSTAKRHLRDFGR